DGPRPPFTVLKPTLERPTTGQTQLIVYYSNPDGSGSEMRLKSPQFPGPWIPSPGDFAKSETGKPVTGTIVARLVDPGPDGHPWHPGSPPTLPGFLAGKTIYLQLEHTPVYRGEDCKPPLDAWTGRLWSAPVAVTVGK